ncbi:class I SAM-dependent methyltransferase [Paracrocinitomix mangrovi]|uniref:class I SAM-dependent methyltransferase n=1 Tax=Paracrocinitomix mangrovi TaxID=2862509 RepID=UPI001C8DB8FB|nr:class I SAM-dependent methyltransferase [Paracrocinitomix mangrovi]UKN00450.1 class I SAM-dependent methyltransferase [Paracrocinitomix mangrovi]
MNKEFWNERYSEKESAYGTEPNVYFKSIIDQLEPGKLLLPCEGEGRNAVYAASTGWQVDAFDQSDAGKTRAEEWAKAKGTSFNYAVCDFEDIEYAPNSYDAIALIYTHFPPDIKRQYHHKIADLIKKGGHIILEGFSKDHLEHSTKNPKAGGPKHPDFLYSLDEIEALFPGFETIELKQNEVVLEEGMYHVGLSSVIRYFGKKK